MFLLDHKLHGICNSLIRWSAIIGLTMTVAACSPSNTLVDEKSTVTRGFLWARQVILSKECPISINLSADEPVGCYLMTDEQFGRFQMAFLHGGNFTYMGGLSATSTTDFSRTARVPAGKWTIVVITADSGRTVTTLAQLFHGIPFAIKISGGDGASVGGSLSSTVPSAPPQAAAPPAYTPPPVRPPPTYTPPVYVPPPPPPLKLTFADLDDALRTLRGGQAAERQAAMGYVKGQEVVAAKRQAVIAALIPLLHDARYAADAAEALVKWASKEEAPALRGALESLIGGNAAGLEPRLAGESLALAKLLLSYGDAESVRPTLLLLRAPSIREEARNALAALGAGAEPAVLEAVARPGDRAGMGDWLGLLGAVGTEKSIAPLQRAMAEKDPSVAKAADEALRKLAARLNLKPDQYLYNLINLYVIEAPAGFTADPTMTQPNTRRWTRQAPGRAVKSMYTVQVAHVGKDYQLQGPPNAPTIPAGALTFQGLEVAPAPQFTQGAHVAALDGEYLIDVTVVVDRADANTERNTTAAVKKIRAK
jgi:hypothetical protein